MGWPAKQSRPTLHWRSKEPNALGQVQPACKHVSGFYLKPSYADKVEDISCQRCKGLCRKGRAM